MTDDDFLLRCDLGGVAHWVMDVPGRRSGTWTPVCQPNTDWLVLIQEPIKGDGPTCLWCIARRMT